MMGGWWCLCVVGPCAWENAGDMKGEGLRAGPHGVIDTGTEQKMVKEYKGLEADNAF